jgi:hypothetical protein
MRAGTSVKTIIHWAQAVRSPRPWFRWFDYGVWCLDWRLRTQVYLRSITAKPTSNSDCNPKPDPDSDPDPDTHHDPRAADVLSGR